MDNQNGTVFDDLPDTPGPGTPIAKVTGTVFDDIPEGSLPPAAWKQNQPNTPNTQEAAGALGWVHNIPRSTFNLLSPMFHPVQAAQGLGNLAMGAAEKMSGATMGEDHTRYVNAVAQALKDRYGSWDAIRKTAYDDPAGFAADVSAVLSAARIPLQLGGMAARTAGMAGMARGLDTGATALQIGSEITNPLNVTKVVTYPAGKLIRGGLGLTTGEGRNVFEIGWDRLNQGGDAAQPFKKAMRGVLTEEDVLNDVKGAAQAVANKRRDDYLTRLGALDQSIQLDLTPIRNDLSNELGKFGAKMQQKFKTVDTGMLDQYGKPITRQVPDGWALDLSEVPIASPSERQLFQDTVNSIMDWRDMSPTGIDRLKQRLADWYSPNSGARALIERVSKQVRGVLESNVPGYSEMTRGYREATDFLNQVRTELSVLPQSHPGTGIRKLSASLKQNNDYRMNLLQELSDQTGKDLIGEVAGSHLSRKTPRGLTERVAGTGAAYGLFADPHILPGIALTSPRLMGEAMVLAAHLKRGGKIVLDPKLLRTEFAGRTAQQYGPVTDPDKHK